MIELDQISKVFNAGKPNAFTALSSIDLRIETNRITVFRGPSGSGKTTLLSVVGCMARPTSGRIYVNGRETTSLPERFTAEIRRETFGFVFQNYNLVKGLSVLENTMIPAYPTGIRYPELKRKALGLLEKLGILSKAQQKVEHLSGGEQQRNAIARALINDPSIVIADEPTAHLDTDLSSQFMGIVTELNKEGKTVLIASHDSLVVDHPCVNRVVSMRDGAVVGYESVNSKR
jgi:putative ABC transport system ATP-binding protein